MDVAAKLDEIKEALSSVETALRDGDLDKADAARKEALDKVTAARSHELLELVMLRDRLRRLQVGKPNALRFLQNGYLDIDNEREHVRRRRRG